jgi:hypothetical protein
MATTTLKKAIIMEEQSIMALFIVLDYELVKVKEHFMFQRRKKLQKFQAKLQTTTTIQAKTSPSKDIPRPTISFGEDSHEVSITFDNSPHLHRNELEA